MDALTASKIKPAMPPNPMPHFVAWLIEVGLVQNGGMAPAPISWLEMEAWQRGVNVKLMPWEARLMRHLSIIYVNQKAKAEDETCPPPWRAEVTEAEVATEESRLRLVLG